MLSYDEVMDICKNYRYKFDYDSKSYTLINSKTKETQQPSLETDKIKAALAAFKVLNAHYNHYPSVSKLSENEQIEWKRKELDKLQKELSGIALKGNYIYKDFFMQLLSVDQQYFSEILKESEGTTSNSVKNLISYLAFEKGKNIENFSFKWEQSGVVCDFSWDVRDIPFSQQLNPKNPQYTQPKKIEQLSPEEKVNRRN